MSDVEIQYLSPYVLSPWAKNPRTHSAKQIRQLAESLREFGFTNPILIDDKNQVLAGHGRLAAAKQLAMELVPCIRLEGLTDIQKRAYVIADNKLALNATWDEELLASELSGLLAEDIKFDIGVTGFSIAEIDFLVEGVKPEAPGDPKDDVLPPLASGETRCKLGDLWELGRHRLICGDALDRGVVSQLMNAELAQMVFSDPPYNVKIAGNVGGLGAVKHREFVMASGEMSPSQFTSFLRSAFENQIHFSVEGSIHFVCMDWRHMAEMLAAGEAYTELKNLIVWAKDSGGMGSFYRSRHELIFAFKHGTAPHINSFELGQHGRYRTNVWQYRGMNSMSADRMDELALHPTIKPVAMIVDAIKDVSERGAIVLDLFGGSGSTLIAAHKTGRRGYLCELDPIYCDRILKRWELLAKDDAVLLARSSSDVADIPSSSLPGEMG